MFKRILVVILVILLFFGGLFCYSYNETLNKITLTDLEYETLDSILISLPTSKLNINYENNEILVKATVNREKLYAFLDSYELSTITLYLGSLVLPESFEIGLLVSVEMANQPCYTLKQVQIEDFTLDTNIILK